MLLLLLLLLLKGLLWGRMMRGMHHVSVTGWLIFFRIQNDYVQSANKIDCHDMHVMSSFGALPWTPLGFRTQTFVTPTDSFLICPCLSWKQCITRSCTNAAGFSVRPACSNNRRVERTMKLITANVTHRISSAIGSWRSYVGAIVCVTWSRESTDCHVIQL